MFKMAWTLIIGLELTIKTNLMPVFPQGLLSEKGILLLD